MMRALREGRPAHARVLNYARSGMSFWCDIKAAPLRNHRGEITHYVAIERDVTHEMRRLDDLETLVERDPLTGMANRRGLERFAAGLTTEDGGSFCIAYIDMDDFKDINDRLGHAVGDAVLMGLSDVICANIRRVDFVGRIGGDEFVVCMPGCQLSDARMVAERLQRAISQHAFDTAAGPVRANCSVGLAAARLDSRGLADVIGRADSALYQAKSAGKGAVAVAGALD
jgi:diguanylate cyclase (GGDEF)-like protein